MVDEVSVRLRSWLVPSVDVIVLRFVMVRDEMACVCGLAVLLTVCVCRGWFDGKINVDDFRETVFFCRGV